VTLDVLYTVHFTAFCLGGPFFPDTVYEKSIGTKINDLDLCLEVVSRSRQPLCYSWRWISRKTLEIEAWFQRTTNRKWHMEYQMVTWPTTSRDAQRCCEAVRSAILATAWLLVNYAPHFANISLLLSECLQLYIYLASSRDNCYSGTDSRTNRNELN